MTHPSSSPPDTPTDPANDSDTAFGSVGRLGPTPTPSPPTPRPAAPRPLSTRPVARMAGTVGTTALLILASAGPAVAAPPASLDEVISRITTWMVRLAFGLAILFVTYGAVRLLTAGGDPVAAEKGKAAIRGAALGFGLALLAPLIVGVLASFVS